tara:strand:- start:896 stop:1696 length:801 start_codon:yes stop_codon:yes gene_type:complete
MQEKNKILIGIVQGRLSNSPKNRLQFFPKNYEKEFKIAKKIGFDFIEFFTERRLNKKNPIWKNKNNIYYELSKKNNLKLHTFCDDHIISNSLLNDNYIKYLKKLITNIQKNKIKNLILPMYGKSLMTDSNYMNFIKKFKKILNYNRNINIYLEGNIQPNTFKEIKNKINSKRLKFLFDSGNRSVLKRDLYEDLLSFKNELGHIHIKDKNKYKVNVMLGKGTVDFKKFFLILSKINYKGNLTLETSRGDNFLKSAKLNLKFVKKYLI